MLIRMPLLVLLLAALPAAAQFGQSAPVTIGEARLITMAPTMQVAGTVVSRADAVLSAEVEGRLIEIADVGTRVEAGAVLARIEDTNLRLRLVELQAEMRRAQARLRFLDAELVRFERLAETNLAAASQIDQTRSERDIARGDQAVIQARIDQIEDQVQRTELRAPFPGVVVERIARAGERLGIGEGVLRLVDANDLEVVARAPLAFTVTCVPVTSWRSAPASRCCTRCSERWSASATSRVMSSSCVSTSMSRCRSGRPCA